MKIVVLSMKRVKFKEIDEDEPEVKTTISSRKPDAEGRKHGEQTVIRYTGSPCCQTMRVSRLVLNISLLVKALNSPPEVVRSQD